MKRMAKPMTVEIDSAENDMRLRVMLEAERLFRAIGYQKTTVADIAKALHMSPGNVYRFFESKRAIYEAVAHSLLSDVESEVRRVAEASSPPLVRFREVLTTIHRLNTERFVGDEKLHEMVAMAMTEDWDVCTAHIEQLTMMIGGVIADGVKAGQFKTDDVPMSAMCVCSAMMRYFHPQIIAQCREKPGPTLDQMVDFLVGGLAPAPR